MRGNVPFQMEMLAKQPGKFAVLPKFEKMFDDMAEDRNLSASQERSLMPEWMAEMFTLRLPGATPRYLQLDLPATDLDILPIGASGWRRIAGMISPFLKYPVERWFGKDFFFGGELWNPELPKHLQTRRVVLPLQYLPKTIQGFLNFSKVKKQDPITGEWKETYQMDARKVHMMRSFLGRFYSSYARAMEEDMTVFDKISHLVAGTPIREVDITREKQRRLFDRQRQLRELVKYYRRRGIIPRDKDVPKDEIRDKMRRHF